MSLAELCSLHEVTIERRSTTKSDGGQPVSAYSTANRTTGTPTANVLCRIVPLSSEKFWSDVGDQKRDSLVKQGYDVFHKVHFAVDPQVDTRDRLKYGTRFLYVQKVKNADEWGRKWTVFCCEMSRTPGPASS